MVIDVHSGAVLAAASATRFDPAAFASGDSAAIARYLADPGHPLFDRTVQMAIPPGSVFKTVTAVALLQDPAFDPQRPFVCQGYLNSPEGRRCMIYRRYGIGHGPVTLVDALAQSCNVYFFHHAAEIGLPPLLLWGDRLGFGEPHGHLICRARRRGIFPTPFPRRRPRAIRASARMPNRWRSGKALSR